MQIGKRAFKDCINITKIIFPQKDKDEDIQIFRNAFEGCSGIVNVVINNIAIIDNYTFSKCTKLKEITIPKSTKIGEYAFNGCTALKTMKFIDNQEKNTGFNIFKNMYPFKNTPMTYINIPFVTEIPSYAFHICEAIEKITIPPSVTRIGPYAFAGCKNLECIVATKCKITEIDTCAFSGCEKLQNASIISSLTIIPEGLFENCNINKLEIPSTVTKIGKKAFFKCKLKKIRIPSSVEEIGDYAFDLCPELSEIDINSTKLKLGTLFQRKPDNPVFIYLYLDSLDDAGIRNIAGLSYIDKK